jgi:hypothetical protein
MCKDLLDEYRQHVEILELELHNKRYLLKNSQEINTKLFNLQNFIYAQCAKQEVYFKEAAPFFKDSK